MKVVLGVGVLLLFFSGVVFAQECDGVVTCYGPPIPSVPVCFCLPQF